MSRKVVHDDDVTAVERLSQTLFDVCEEDCPVHRPIDHEGCDHPVVAQSDNQGDGLPMAVGNGPDQSFAPRATAPKSHQAGAGGGLVDKHQSGGIKQALLANPAPPRPRHVRPFLLARAGAAAPEDRKSPRLNSSHGYISDAGFCLKKKNNLNIRDPRPLQRLQPELANTNSDIARSSLLAATSMGLTILHYLGHHPRQKSSDWSSTV